MNKYLTKIAKKEENRQPTTWTNMGMSRNTAGTVMGVASTPVGAMLGGIGAIAGSSAFIKNQSDKAIHHKDKASTMHDVEETQRAGAEKELAKERPVAKNPSHRSLHGEYIPKDSKAIPHIDAGIEAGKMKREALGKYNKYSSRILKTLKAQPYLAGAGAIAGGYLGYKGGKAAGKWNWDVNEALYGDD